MSKRLKVGVAGAGVFGGYHSQKYAQASKGPGVWGEAVEFVGVYDLDLARAQSLAETHGVKAHAGAELDSFLSQLDAITITTPAFAHGEVALKALEAGVHVYTEKPLAITEDDGEAMVALAEAKGLILACGHQERAVFEAIGLYDIPERPKRLEAVRNGMVATRNLDVSVVLDLMIHDLDLAISLSQGEAAGVTAKAETYKAEGYKAVGADQVEAEVIFDSGFTAHFKASRMAPQRERTMKLIFESGVIEIDFLTRSFVNTTPHRLDPLFAEADIAKDPLGTSVYRYLGAIAGASKPLCPGSEAVLALELALSIDEA